MSIPYIPTRKRSHQLSLLTDCMSSHNLVLLFLLKLYLWIDNKGERVEIKSVWECEKKKTHLILNKNVLVALLPILIATV